MPPHASMTGPVYHSQWAIVDGLRLHYVESGAHEPTVVLLHGIPTNCYLWRNVIPFISPTARTIAVDLPGFGKSEKHLYMDYDLATHSYYLNGFIEELKLKNVVIAGMDLGWLTGLDYAIRHPEKLSGLVMFEGLILPVDQAVGCQSLMARFGYRVMGNRKVAESTILGSDKAVDKMISMGTVRRLSSQEVAAYREPFNDVEVRRKVWLNGPGAYTLQNGRGEESLQARIDENIRKLQTSRLPKLLITGKPGMAVTKKTVEKARRRYERLRVVSAGSGKHYLPEDQPDKIGREIAGFVRDL